MTIPVNLLEDERVILDAPHSTRSMVFEAIAEMLSDSDLPNETIITKLTEREELGSTGIGFGVAIPHARINSLKSTRAAFIRTSAGVDFNAPDETSVDLIFALLVTEGSNEDYLRLLAQLARFFSEEENRQLLRDAESTEAIISLLTGSDTHRQTA